MKKKILLAVLFIPLFFLIIAGIQGIIKSNGDMVVADYEIIEDSDRYSRGQIRDMKIQLKQKIHKNELEKLGNYLSINKEGHETIWMFYFIEGDSSRAWASTHVNPKLEAVILGSSIEQDSLMLYNLLTKSPGKILSAWKGQSDLMGWHFSLSEQENNVLFSTFFNDGFHKTDTISLLNNKFKMENDEFAIIEKDGSLTFHSMDKSPYSVLNKLDLN
nr:hypothetical protein [uncultured Allomuricauda sp.]